MDVLSLSSGATSLLIRGNSDDEFADRLNYRYTVGLLLFFTLIVSTKQSSSEVTNLSLDYSLRFGSFFFALQEDRANFVITLDQN